MIPLSNFRIYENKVPQSIFNKIKKLVDIAKANESANSSLVGHIEHEYNLNAEKDPEINYYLFNTIKQSPFFSFELHKATRAFSYKRQTEHKLELEITWVNFQKKYEFNPIHNHIGLFSYIIFIKIPYDTQKEKEKYIKMKANDIRAGMLSFFDYEPDWGIKEIPIELNSKIEGTILIFPSKLSHQVYPFYSSDEERITVSGNLVLK